MSAVALTAGCGQTPDSRPYPDGDITLIVPAEAGETTDTVARAVAPCLAGKLGVTVAVRNQPGQDGVLGNRALLDAEPDGRTLMISSVGSTVVTPLLPPKKDYGYDDFRFLGVVHSAPVVLFTAANSPVDSAGTLLRTAKADGPPVTVANRGDKTVEGFTLWHLNSLAKTRLEPAPVDSDAEILRTVVAGSHTAGLATLTPELLAAITSGQVRLLASGGHRRPEYLPEVPTLYEAVGRKFSDAVPDLVVDTAFSARSDIGDAKSSTLSSTLSQCLSTDDVKRGIGAEFVPAGQGAPSAQRERYRKLQSAVLLGLDMAEIEGR